VVIDESGREDRHVNNVRVDGEERASGNGYSVLARWLDSHTLTTVGKKDGVIIGVATYQVSQDGQTLTISGEQQSIVLDRAQG
jgi:hypothetical protein